MISFENVSKFVLSQVSIHIPAGSSVGVIGAVGAGKTTFLRLACGLLQAEEGNIYVAGRKQTNYSTQISAKLGVLFTDKPILNAEESVRSNFEIVKTVYRLSERKYQKEYEKLSRQLGFCQFEDKKVKALSFGEKRRAELGAVLIHEPQLLLLDEPTNGLDENAKEAFRSIIKERTAKGMTAVISSHDLADITHTCQRIAILHKGTLLYYGNEDLLLRRFAPIDSMRLNISGIFPDMEDLPLERYCVDDHVLTLYYNSNHITSAEILRNIIPQTSIKEIKVNKQDLTTVIMKIEKDKGKKNEQLYRSKSCM